MWLIILLGILTWIVMGKVNAPPIAFVTLVLVTAISCLGCHCITAQMEPCPRCESKGCVNGPYKPEMNKPTYRCMRCCIKFDADGNRFLWDGRKGKPDA